jgi:hypothetical protein
MFDQNDDEELEFKDLDFFCKHTRLFAFCNMELSIDPLMTKEDKDITLPQHFENSQSMMDSEELEIFMPLSDVQAFINPYLTYDEVDQLYRLPEKQINPVVTSLTIEMVRRTYKSLENDGIVELAWDAKKNDFVYVPKKDVKDGG